MDYTKQLNQPRGFLKMTRKTKLYLIFPFSFITAFILTGIITIKISNFFDLHRLKFNQPVQIKLLTPVEVLKREPEVITQVINIDYSDEIDTPIEKYICDKFGLLDCKVALAIVKAESNFNEQAIHVNDNGTVDLGCWQINFPTHKETISPKEALDCYKATDWAYEKYQRDGNFNAWVAFTNGKFKTHL